MKPVPLKAREVQAGKPYLLIEVWEHTRLTLTPFRPLDRPRQLRKGSLMRVELKPRLEIIGTWWSADMGLVRGITEHYCRVFRDTPAIRKKLGRIIKTQNIRSYLELLFPTPRKAERAFQQLRERAEADRRALLQPYSGGEGLHSPLHNHN